MQYVRFKRTKHEIRIEPHGFAFAIHNVTRHNGRNRRGIRSNGRRLVYRSNAFVYINSDGSARAPYTILRAYARKMGHGLRLPRYALHEYSATHLTRIRAVRFESRVLSVQPYVLHLQRKYGVNVVFDISAHGRRGDRSIVDEFRLRRTVETRTSRGAPTEITADGLSGKYDVAFTADVNPPPPPPLPQQ